MTSGTLSAHRNFQRSFKGWVYSLLPAGVSSLHGKRRKGFFYRYCDPGILECQEEQDAVFWRTFLRPKKGGAFLEIGAGDGVVGSHTLGLELQHQWSGWLWEPSPRARQKAQPVRRCRVADGGQVWPAAEPIDLLAIHRPGEFPEIWSAFPRGRALPPWVIVENPHPEDRWARVLEGVGYELRFFFHDDEYYALKG